MEVFLWSVIDVLPGVNGHLSVSPQNELRQHMSTRLWYDNSFVLLGL